MTGVWELGFGNGEVREVRTAGLRSPSAFGRGLEKFTFVSPSMYQPTQVDIHQDSCKCLQGVESDQNIETIDGSRKQVQGYKIVAWAGAIWRINCSASSPQLQATKGQATSTLEVHHGRENQMMSSLNVN